MYLCSHTLIKTSLKNSFGKVVYQILVREIKIRILAAILKQKMFEFSFCWIMVALDAYRYDEFVRKFLQKVLHSAWVQVDPLVHKREWKKKLTHVGDKCIG